MTPGIHRLDCGPVEYRSIRRRRHQDVQTIAPEAPAYKPIPVSRRVGETIRSVADNVRQRVVSGLETLGRSARLFAEILYFVVADSVA